MKCGNCGGSFEGSLREGADFVQCKYCGASIWLLKIPEKTAAEEEASSTSEHRSSEAEAKGTTDREKVVKEESEVRYHSGVGKIQGPLFGKLVLSDQRLVFLEQRLVRQVGYFSRRKDWDAVGIRLDLPLSKIIVSTTDSRQRKPGTINEPPSIFRKENYDVLIISFGSETGIENPCFEVSNAQEWAKAIQSAAGGIGIVVA